MPQQKPRKSSKRTSLNDLPVKPTKAKLTRGGALTQSTGITSPTPTVVAPTSTSTTSLMQMQSAVVLTIGDAMKTQQDITSAQISNVK